MEREERDKKTERDRKKETERERQRERRGLYPHYSTSLSLTTLYTSILKMDTVMTTDCISRA